MKQFFLTERKYLDRRQLCWLLCFATLVGCGRSRAHAVKVDVAKKTLISVLDGWKEGKTPEDFRKGTPSIVVQEMEWTNGSRLVDYEIIGDGDAVNQNLHANVKLKLETADGKAAEKTASYVVGTSPALTVIRNIMKR